MTSWYIIRHAEKEQGDFYNSRLRHQDQPISPKGEQDARKLGSFLSGKPIAAVYVSAYRRTRQTIEAAHELNLTPIVDDRLNEIDNGCFEGMTEQEIQRAFPDIWNVYREGKSDFRFPEGETGEEAQKRIIDFLEEKRQIHGAENIVIVSHDGLIRLLMCYIVAIPVFKRRIFHVDTCGIMEITYQPDLAVWRLVRFNQTCC